VFEIVDPLAFISFPLGPDVLPCSLHFVVLILALVVTSVGKGFKAVAVPLVIFPVPLVFLPTVVEHYAFPLPAPAGKFSVVDCFFVFFEFEGGGVVEGSEVEVL